MEASQQVPGSPAEVRPHGDVALLSRQSRRRDGGELAHEEGYGIREPSDAEQLGGPRRRGEESERGDHPGGLFRPSDQWQFGQPGRRPHSETEGVGGSHGRPELAKRTAPRTHPAPKRRSGDYRGKGSGLEGGAEDVEVEGGSHQDKEQIGTRRRRVPEERAFRDATQRREESEQRIRGQGKVRRGGEDHGTGEIKEPRKRRRRHRRREESPRRPELEEGQEEEQVVEETEPRHRAPEVGQRKRQEDERTQPDSGCSGESGEDASVSEAEVETAVEALRKWLRDNPMDGLTTVQCGAHLLLQVVKSGTAFGKYVRRMVEPHGEEEQGRQKSVLPLPLKEDSLNELKKIIASGEYRRLAGTWKEKQNMGASKTKKEMRKSGLLILARPYDSSPELLVEWGSQSRSDLLWAAFKSPIFVPRKIVGGCQGFCR